MARNTEHYVDLGACEICANCISMRNQESFCACNNSNFGGITYPNECDDYEEFYDEDEDEDKNDFDPNKPIACPICGSDAFWEGSSYECDQCGWCGSNNKDY